MPSPIVHGQCEQGHISAPLVTLIAAAAGVLTLVVVALLVLTPSPAAIRLALRTTAPTRIALVSRGDPGLAGWRDERLVPASPDGITLDFPLPSFVVSSTRLVLPAGSAPVVVVGVELLHRDGSTVAVASFVAESEHLGVTQSSAGIRLTGEPGNDGGVLLRLRYPLLPRHTELWALAGVLVALLIALFFVWKSQRASGNHPILASPVLLRVVVVALAVAVLSCAAVMVMSSRLAAHPDEAGHVAAGRYYVEHWLPSPIGDSQMEPTMMAGWARSYLFDIDVVYFLAGKTMGQLGEPLFHLLRGFHLILLAGLFVLAIRLVLRLPTLMLVLGLTPQVWYVFSYFNGDAFPLAMALLAAVLIAEPLSTSTANDGAGDSTNQSRPVRHVTIQTLVLGVVLGIILISKANYRLFALYALGVMVISWLMTPPGPHRRRGLRQLALVAIIATSIFAVRWGYEEGINGFAKAARIQEYVDANASPRFRHSTMRTTASSPGMYLREKGHGLGELLTHSGWIRLTYMSFFGLYGQMALPSPRVYYILASGLLLMLVVILCWLTWRGGGKQPRLVLLLSLATLGPLLAQSLARSWLLDFEPQGRYLFPVLPILVVGLSSGVHKVPRPVLVVMLLAVYGLSLWCYIAIALQQLTS